jgi:hypothetical protein
LWWAIEDGQRLDWFYTICIFLEIRVNRG